MATYFVYACVGLGLIMKQINQLVTIDINSKSYDCTVWGYHYEESLGMSEQYDLNNLYVIADDIDISDMLNISDVRDDIVKQLDAGE